MIYIVQGEDFQSNDIDEIIDYCIADDYHDEDDDCFEEWVNDRYGYIDIGETRYYAYDILNTDDNIRSVLPRYQEEQNENDTDTAYYDLRHADDGEEVYVQAYRVKCLYDDEEENDDDLPYEPCDTGDYDGDGYLDKIRIKIAEAKAARQAETESDANSQDDYLKMFQTIGG